MAQYQIIYWFTPSIEAPKFMTDFFAQYGFDFFSLCRNKPPSIGLEADIQMAVEDTASQHVAAVIIHEDFLSLLLTKTGDPYASQASLIGKIKEYCASTYGFEPFVKITNNPITANNMTDMVYLIAKYKNTYGKLPDLFDPAEIAEATKLHIQKNINAIAL